MAAPPNNEDTHYVEHTMQHITEIFETIATDTTDVESIAKIHYDAGGRARHVNEMYLHLALATVGVRFKDFDVVTKPAECPPGTDIVSHLCSTYTVDIPVIRAHVHDYAEYNGICEYIYKTRADVCGCKLGTDPLSPAQHNCEWSNILADIEEKKKELPNMIAELIDRPVPVTKVAPVAPVAPILPVVAQMSVGMAIIHANQQPAQPPIRLHNKQLRQLHKTGEETLEYYRDRHKIFMWFIRILNKDPRETVYIRLALDDTRPGEAQMTADGSVRVFKSSKKNDRLCRWVRRMCRYMFEHTNVYNADPANSADRVDTKTNPTYTIRINDNKGKIDASINIDGKIADSINIDGKIADGTDSNVSQNANLAYLKDPVKTSDNFQMLLHYIYISRAYKLLRRQAYIEHGDITLTPCYTIHSLDNIGKDYWSDPRITCLLFVHTPTTPELKKKCIFDIAMRDETVSTIHTTRENHNTVAYKFFDISITAVAMKAYLKKTPASNVYTYALRQIYIESPNSKDVRLGKISGYISSINNANHWRDILCRNHHSKKTMPFSR